jgi:hypothetical protein
MAKVSEHLLDLHQKACADRTEAINNHQSAMEEEKAMGSGQRSFHKAEIARHQKALDYHTAKMEECSKAIISDMNKVQPTLVSAVAPDAPGIKAVPRAGQRPIEEAKPQVEAQFAKLVAVDEDENDPARL